MDENLNNTNLDEENLNESEENKEETNEEVQTNQEEVKETVDQDNQQTDEQPVSETDTEQPSSQEEVNFTIVDQLEDLDNPEENQQETSSETIELSLKTQAEENAKTDQQNEESQQETTSQTTQQTEEKTAVVNKIEKIDVDRQEAVNPKEKKKKEKKESSFNSKQFIVTLVLCILVSIVSSFATIQLVKDDTEGKVVYVNNSSGNTTTTETVVASDYSEVVEKVADSVVEVYTEEVTYSNGYGSYISEGAGSGVIFTSDGYIVTNAHVIEDASTITVTLHNGETYEATLVASDTQSDIAVLKIEADGLTPVVIGDSDSLKVGQFCIAIGNPLGTLGGTVTAGIISALERQVTVDDIPMNLMQINVSVSPGNSGGGLFNTSGELIGIVNAKSTSEYSEGIGFAIPVNDVVEVATELISQGYVSGRPMLGITCISIESIQTAWSYGVNTYGVYVTEITVDSTAEAGLEVGDVITGIDDTDVSSYDDLKTAMYYYSAGDKVTLTVVRGNETLEIEVTLVQKQ